MSVMDESDGSWGNEKRIDVFRIISFVRMENDFECIKIKDGLYLSNLATAQDGQFLQINKFAYVVNCSAETPNHFEAQGIKYLKFKLLRDKPHKLWDEHTKKLQKLQRFIEEAEENALCCLVFSAQGNNRSLVMLVSLLMSKFRWTMGKALQYVRSKNVFIGLSEHYIAQLEALQEILMADETKPPMTYGWKGPYSSEEQEIIARTFLNSQEIIYTRDCGKTEKKAKRIVWQDKLDKQKKKETRSRGVDISVEKRARKTLLKAEEGVVGAKNIKKTMEEPLKKQLITKKFVKVPETSKMQRVESDEEEDVNSSHKQNQPLLGMATDINFFNEKELIRLIKKNIKIKKETAQIEKDSSKNNMSNHSNLGNPNHEVPPSKEIYQLTINNFIQPNINIMNGPERASQHGRFLKDKVNRALSEKQKPEQKLQKVKTCKPKSIQKKTEGSPRRERRLQKTHSLQFRKNV